MRILKVLLCLILISGSGGYMRFDSLRDSFSVASSVVVTVDGTDQVFFKGDKAQNDIIKSLLEITEHSHEMPAFGVSIDNHTREARKKGVWLELIFDSASRHEGMDFESLLIYVGEEDYGFNLVRKTNGKYEGRCFYLSLDGSTKKLYKSLTESVTEKQKDTV